MKVSKIINNPKFINGTIVINKDNSADLRAFLKSENKRKYSIINKHYKTIEIDIELRELPLWTVEHLGYVRYRDWKGNDKSNYLNVYNL